MQHLKEIGYAADMGELDDLTMNCFLIISDTFGKCREDEIKKQKRAKGRR